MGGLAALFSAIQEMPMISRSARWLSLLHQLADLLDKALSLEQTLETALQLLARELHVRRGAITLVNPISGKIRIRAAWGLNAGQRKRGEYEPGEGITGHVIASGKPMLVANVAEEPLFLNRTDSRAGEGSPLSLLCVPIRLAGLTVGALWLDQPAAPVPELQAQLELLEIAASMLAHTAYDSQESTEADWARPRGFTGNSQPMLQVYTQIAIVAPTLTTVYLKGESGTGKELAARAIHHASGRASGPFVSLNCAALPENLIESELFGHEKGAFTGASQMRKGRFELANGGTLFLDEIGELSLFVQAKLLRVLQERTFERVGGSRSINLDARLIVATNRDLAQMVSDNAFRRDLFYRLNVFPILLPPLRERREDIPALAAQYLRQLGKLNDSIPHHLSLAALEAMQRYSWPGNVREMQNALERASLLCGGGSTILPQHLPDEVRLPERPVPATPLPVGLQDRLEEVERACILDAMTHARGNLHKAAAQLGLTDRILGLRLKKYGLSYKMFRKEADQPDQN